MLLGEDPCQTSLAFLLNLVFADSQMSTSTLPTSSQEPAVAMAATTRRDPFIALGPMKGTSRLPTRSTSHGRHDSLVADAGIPNGLGSIPCRAHEFRPCHQQRQEDDEEDDGG